MELLRQLVDTEGFPPRWDCGTGWTPVHGWLHVLSDLGVWSAYVAIPCVLGFFLLRRKDLPFRLIFLLFGAFILACGMTHFMEALIFWWPAYRLAGAIKLFTAIVSWATVLALIPVVPRVLSMRTPEELEREIAARKNAEDALQRANEELERRIEERTAELQTMNAMLQHERERFRTTLASIGDGVIATDIEGRVTFLNWVAEKLTGWNLVEAQGRLLSEVFHLVDEETRLPVADPAQRALREGKAVALANHTILISRDKTEWPLDDSAAPIRGNSGIHGAVLVFREITERKRQQAQLRESEERFRTLADNIPQLAWMTRPDGHIFWYNRRWYEYTGGTPEQMEGWGWQSVHDPATLPRVLARFREHLASGEPWEDTFPLRRHDGAMRWHLSRALPVRDELGKVVRWFGTNTDITELRTMEEALRDADRKKDDFLAMLSHELRNPLAPIRNGIEVLRLAGSDPETLVHVRAMMERQIQQMVHLVDDLLDVSRITRGKIELRKSCISLDGVLAHAVEMSRPLFEKAGNELTLSGPLEPIHVFADATRLAQVFGNLLSNSAKYTPRGGRVSLAVEHADSTVIVRVRDNGIGIPADMLERIFDMFTQVEHALDRSQGGLGIGLTIVRRLIVKHGGTVVAHSEGEGKGSEFVVTLPTVPAPAKPPEPTPAASKPLVRRKILVVDDNNDSAESLRLMLSLMGHDVRTAHDGHEAIESADAYRPDIIFMDIGMPRLDGHEATRRIRASNWAQNTVIIAMTGWGQESDKSRSREVGCNSHLTKPVDPAALAYLLASL